MHTCPLAVLALTIQLTLFTLKFIAFESAFNMRYILKTISFKKSNTFSNPSLCLGNNCPYITALALNMGMLQASGWSERLRSM